MKTGASTACFYPLETEKALTQVIELGFEKAEVFMNAPCELEKPFLKRLNGIVSGSGTEIVSVHPFSSFLESSCIFGDYERRFNDYIGLYQQTCYAAAELGARFVVIHGAVAQPKIPIPDERYFERFKMLIELGRREGVTVCQENVNKFKSQSIDFCKKMRAALGSDYNMVFDIKQSVRAGEDPFEFINEFAGEIVHMHISDNGEAGDCLPIGKGNFSFKKLKAVLDSFGYGGDCVIEIYSKNYDVKSVLKESKVHLDRLWQM